MKNIIMKSCIPGATIGVSFISVIFMLIDGLYSYFAIIPSLFILIFPTIVIKWLIEDANKCEQEKEIIKTINSIDTIC